MLRRKLLYTAITRSKQSLIICGEEEAFRIGIEREDDQLRKTSLYDKLCILEKINPQEENKGEIFIFNEENMFKVDPMIGMENITPYDFLS